ncbi:glycosyltransferase [Synechococcus sp. CS-602]|uniref:glycosyltransferase n=1 Tax=Synechococcaceae TaxID=1890426 RepID=UPI0008FF15BA|nr:MULTISPECIES: glycosyltransferase [Synechococcaceae]APD48152.1 glycosyl transferase family 1 [Synechococcus sp. SynAce01]MCT0203384.1 glycosyltransferase [Synechococcus sp. CS-603]MCT0204032.1 glycosyltransferase [Synechococcus sp. CS-602]MCT0246604.1 glycosyltransferase [Synechococcus sp. CS-601]MCT4366973.1 glycosyltransferase [Candidatus Regnicoccus frigidus MAG-AL2]
MSSRTGSKASPVLLKLLVFAPSRRAPSETFIRANLRALPCATTVYCGDERPWCGPPLRLAYGLAILASKVLDRLGCQRLASWIPAQVAIAICRRERPDVVLAEFGFHAVRVMELVPATGLPLIVHFRGADASSSRYLQRLKPRYRRLLQLCSAVVVKSQPMASTLRGLASERATPLPVLISPSGADPDRFSGADPAAAAPLFLAVGRFVAKKGPLITLEAFAQASQGRPAGLRLVMVGAGPLLEQARQLALALGVEAQVQFPGLQTPEQIADWMRRSRAFLQHSLTGPDGDQEGSPVAVMEAQLSGLPVVATRHAGIPEVVLEGETGLLVEEGDRDGMAAAIGRLADDPALAEQLGLAGRARCSAQFTVSHHIEQLMDLIERVRADGPPSAFRRAP